jgi:hypothetical protein
MRAKATSQILTLAHRCGVCNERLLVRSRVMNGGWMWASSKPFVLLRPEEVLLVGL